MSEKNWVVAAIIAVIGFVIAPTAVFADSIFWQEDHSVLYGNTDTYYVPWWNTSFVAFNQVIEQLNNNQPIGVVGTVTSFTIYAENPEATIAYAYLPNTQLMWGPSKWEGDRGNEGAAGNFGYMTTVSATSTGHYVTFQLSSPVVLDPNTYYLISLGYTRQLPNDPQSMGVLGGSVSGICSNYWGGSLPTLRCPGFNQFAYWLNDESGYNGVLKMNHQPKITVSGDDPLVLDVGETFDPNAIVTAYDEEDGDITAHIVITSTLNSNVVGTYEIRYNVKDSRMIPAYEVVRKVYVIPKGNTDGRVCFYGTCKGVLDVPYFETGQSIMGLAGRSSMPNYGEHWNVVATPPSKVTFSKINTFVVNSFYGRGGVTIKIYADSNGKPSTLLHTSDTLTDFCSENCSIFSAVRTWTFPSTVTFDANNTYHVVFERDDSYGQFGLIAVLSGANPYVAQQGCTYDNSQCFNYGGWDVSYYDVPMTFCGEDNCGTAPIQQKPILTLPTETGYDDNGLYPNKGVANKDVLTFKAVYADEDETPADKVTATIDTTVHFDTDEFYPHHVSLSDKAVFVDSKNIHPGLATARLVGQKRNLLDGPNLSEGEILEIPLLRSHIRRATTTLVAVAEVFRFGDVNAEFVLEALGSSGDVIGHQSTTITLDPDVPFVDNILLAVSADSDIASLRLTVLHANDTVGWLKNIMTEADMLMKNDGDGSHFTASGTFPKGVYTYVFTASSTDGLATRFPESGALSFTTGYSSVAFVPGIKASRLFDAQGIINDNQLWEPNRDGDVQKLAMYFDAQRGTGVSSSTDIYTKTNGGIIGEVNVVLPSGPGVSADVYVDFINDMNALVEKGAIAEWKALPYDWRLDFTNLLKSGKEIDGKIYYDTAYESSAPYILEQIKRLAENSDSGKVTIVAHSMGGLIAKKMLYDIEHDSSSPYHSLIQNKRIDSLILVASPQLGTPQAITGMLHGYEQELDIPAVGWPNFAKGETMRALSTTMQSAYNLLPAEMYTKKISDLDGHVFRPADSALMSFDSKTLKNLNDPLFNAASTMAYYRTHYPNESAGATTTIRSYDAMRDFLKGTDGRISAEDNDLTHPKTLILDMLDRAKTMHQEIDNWVSPDNESDGVPDIRVVQIAGWGMPETVKGVTYGAKEVPDGPFECGLIGCGFSGTKWVLDIRPDFTSDGDETVVVPSAVAMGEVSDASKGVETYYVDLYTHNDNNVDRDHGDIFEVTNVLDLIENLVQYKSDPIANLTYIKKTQAELPKDSLPSYLRLSMHSPVNVHIYDKEGNHVGASSTTEVFDENIPNSYYLEFGEGKYLGVPLETGEQYTIKLEGTGSGIFTFEMVEEKGGVIQKTQTFSSIPTSTTTKSTLTLSSLGDVTKLALDYDGNGSVDDVVLTDEYKNIITFNTIQTEIQKLPSKISDSLAKQIENAKKLSDKKLYLPAQVLLQNVQKQLFVYTKTKTPKQMKIEYQDALRISAMLDVLIDEMKIERGEKVSRLKERIEEKLKRWKDGE